MTHSGLGEAELIDGKLNQVIILSRKGLEHVAGNSYCLSELKYRDSLGGVGALWLLTFGEMSLSVSDFAMAEHPRRIIPQQAIRNDESLPGTAP
jgi:hypothetical protein